MRYFKYCLIVFSVVFLLFIIMDKIVMPLYVRLGDEIKMPDVTGEDRYEAKLQLERLGFKVDDNEKKYHPYSQLGEVLSQSPPPFTRVKKKRLVRLTISLGEEKIKVPDLFLLSPREAELELLKNNLKLGKRIFIFLPEYTEGVVIAQSYEKDMEVPKGTVVNITINRGQKPENVTVPYVENNLLENAIDILEKNLLHAGPIEYQLDINNEYLPNTVLFQNPKAGEIVFPGDSVQLWISKIDTTNYFQKYIRSYLNR